MRTLAFGPIALRLDGPLAETRLPRGVTAIEVPDRADAKLVQTELVARLPPLTQPVIDAGPWRSEALPGGMRFAIVVPPDATVIADLLWEETMLLRVVRDFVGFDRAPWFDILVQLAVAEMAPTFGGLALHAACVKVAGRAVVLCGRSGAGKTTLGDRLIRVGGQRLSHDRTLVFESGAWRAVSTPWGHDGMLASVERDCALGSVLFLEKAPRNSSEQLSGARAASRLASVMLGARSAKAVMNEAIGVVERLVREVPCHVVRLTNDDRAAEYVLELIG